MGPPNYRSSGAPGIHKSQNSKNIFKIPYGGNNSSLD